MRSDSMCTANALDQLVMRVHWCADCERWHFRLSRLARMTGSSRRWTVEDEWDWDHTPEADGYGFSMFAGVAQLVRDLQRLFAEQEAGVQRLL